MIATALLIVALLFLIAAALPLSFAKLQVGWAGMAFYVAAGVCVALKLP